MARESGPGVCGRIGGHARTVAASLRVASGSPKRRTDRGAPEAFIPGGDSEPGQIRPERIRGRDPAESATAPAAEKKHSNSTQLRRSKASNLSSRMTGKTLCPLTLVLQLSVQRTSPHPDGSVPGRITSRVLPARVSGASSSCAPGYRGAAGRATAKRDGPPHPRVGILPS